MQRPRCVFLPAAAHAVCSAPTQHERGRLLCLAQAEVMMLAKQLLINIKPNFRYQLSFQSSPIITNAPAFLILLFKRTCFVSEVSEFSKYYLGGLRVIIIILFNMISWRQPPSQKVWCVPCTHDFH